MFGIEEVGAIDDWKLPIVPHIQDLLVWYGQFQLQVKFLNFFGILHICRLYCFAIQSHSDGKCRSTFDVLATSPPHTE